MEVRVVTLEESENDEKIVFSEKDVWSEKQKDVISKYKVGTIIKGDITAVTDFGVFVSFAENLEGLIHISELAWQRIDNPSDLFKVGDKIKAEVINIDGSKIFLSSKKLMKDPWDGVEKKYKVGEKVRGTILKVNPFGLFVELDKDIHGLAHVSQLVLSPGQKITDIFKSGEEMDFEIVTIEPKEHRLGLIVFAEKKKTSKATAKKEDKEAKVDVKESKKEKKSDKKDDKKE
jgi:small subunit ribosomal protein S1